MTEQLQEIIFKEFPKIPRLNREMIVTEKIDGTNGQIIITDDGRIQATSRSQLIYPEKSKDNHGFAAWVQDNKETLLQLGPGRHFGEWWGFGIQRGYRLPKGEKRFSLFNVDRWSDVSKPPSCCHCVPVLYRGLFSTNVAHDINFQLGENGSKASPGFMKPEGIIVFHVAANFGFKMTLDRDDLPKSNSQ